MINNPIVYSQGSQAHVDTFNGLAAHWDGTCNTRKAFRKEVRDYYRDEQRLTCPYCGRFREEFHGGVWDIDHIIPKSSYPEYLYTPKNLAVTCKDCNTHKSNKSPLSSPIVNGTPYPVQRAAYKIIHPHLDRYDQHITLSRDAEGRSCHVPFTDKGRETFSMCKLIRFSEALAGTSEFVPELGTEIGIADELGEDVLTFLEDFEVFASHYSPAVAERALQAIIRRRNHP